MSTKHREKENVTSNYKYQCDLYTCHDSFITMKELKNHIALVHKGERQYLCPICDKGCQSNKELITHLGKHIIDFLHNCKLSLYCQQNAMVS